MKKLIFLLHFTFIIFHSTFSFGQDTLFIENFDSASVSFTLNTTDINSEPAGYNYWVNNNAYTGGSGSIVCLGFPFTFTIPTTASQPSGVNSAYMHTVSTAAVASSVSNCCFLSADGLCNIAENYFTKMTNDINTQAYDSVNFFFLWLCDGGNNSYGEVYYSTDGGLNWTQTTAPQKYNSQATWVQKNISLPAFAHQSTLRFGFRFVNQVATTANDPGFGIDDIRITANTFTGIAPLSWIEGLGVKCFPNPAKDETTITGYTLQNNQPAQLKIYDVMGNEVYKSSVTTLNIKLKTLNFSSGVYFMQLQTGASISQAKFVKQ